MSNGTDISLAQIPTDDERIAAIVAYEGHYPDMEKLALETMARTAKDPLFCFELAMSMNRLRTKIGTRRTAQRAGKRQEEINKAKPHK